MIGPPKNKYPAIPLPLTIDARHVSLPAGSVSAADVSQPLAYGCAALPPVRSLATKTHR